MADKKISQLSAATTPLAGTEVLPIVQSGSTVKVSAADVTAGRAVSASSVAVTGSTAPANGVYLPAANSVGIATNSSNAVYINSSGNVSIAAGNAPTQTLNLYRTGSTQTVMAAGNSNTGLNGTYFGVDTAGNAIINQTQSLALNLQTVGVTRLSASAVGDVTVNTGNLVVGTADKGIQDNGNVSRVSIATSATVINESGADIDFRVEGTGDANLIFADASTYRVGIGTNSPGSKLDVREAECTVNVQSSTGTNFVWQTFKNTGGTIYAGIERSTGGILGPTGAYEAFYIYGGTGGMALGSGGNGYVRFLTNNTERARITTAGSFVAGAQAALATNATDGFLYVPTCAGTPTGVPTAITGMAPIVVDTTNNKLYFYSGGTWRDAGP